MKTYCTTVIIGRSGKVYDLGKGEFPTGELSGNAFTCTQEEADKLRGNRPVKNVLWRKKKAK